MKKEGIDLSKYTFTFEVAANGEVTVHGIENEEVKSKMERILWQYSNQFLDTYITASSTIQNLSRQEQSLLKTGIEVESFLYKATKRTVSLKDIMVQNGVIKGLPAF